MKPNRDSPTESRRIAEEIRALNPAYFALVMATGIVAVAARFNGFDWIAYALGSANYVFAAVLYVLYLLRCVLYPHAVLSDLRDPKRAVGFLTIVAGTCILGNQSLLVFESARSATFFLAAGVVLWFICMYGVLAFLTLSPQKPEFANSIHGGWLVFVVATQAVAILLALLAPHWQTLSELGLFGALCMWLAAGMLYV